MWKTEPSSESMDTHIHCSKEHKNKHDQTIGIPIKLTFHLRVFFLFYQTFAVVFFLFFVLSCAIVHKKNDVDFPSFFSSFFFSFFLSFAYLYAKSIVLYVRNSYCFFFSLLFSYLLINENSIIYFMFAWMIIVYRQIFAFICLHCPSLSFARSLCACVGYVCVRVHLWFCIIRSAFVIGFIHETKFSVPKNFNSRFEVQIFTKIYQINFLKNCLDWIYTKVWILIFIFFSLQLQWYRKQRPSKKCQMN